MRYFARMADPGIVVRAAESADDLQESSAWREVPNMRQHCSEKGLDNLNAGKRMVFTQDDQSWPQLLRLLSS